MSTWASYLHKSLTIAVREVWNLRQENFIFLNDDVKAGFSHRSAHSGGATNHHVVGREPANRAVVGGSAAGDVVMSRYRGDIAAGAMEMRLGQIVVRRGCFHLTIEKVRVGVVVDQDRTEEDPKQYFSFLTT